MMSATLKRFISWGFIFCNAAKHKITRCGVIVPKEDMTIENEFGHIFFNVLWNGLLLHSCKFRFLVQFLLVVPTSAFVGMTFMLKYVIDGQESEAE